jgi:hypothetical protein
VSYDLSSHYSLHCWMQHDIEDALKVKTKVGVLTDRAYGGSTASSMLNGRLELGEMVAITSFGTRGVSNFRVPYEQALSIWFILFHLYNT